MRFWIVLFVCGSSLGAYADVIRLADGQVISGKIQSCQGGEIVVAPPATAPVLVKVADVASGEGVDIERCLGGPTPTRDAVGGRWYGAQILLAELASLGLGPVGAWTNTGSLALVGAFGVLFSPAIIYGIHGNWGRAAGSAGIHVGLGLAGAFLGAAVGSGSNDDDEGLRAAGGAVIGLIASQIVATTIDVASFAYEDPPPRVSMGVLFRETAPDRRGQRAAPAGLSLTLRF